MKKFTPISKFKKHHENIDVDIISEFLKKESTSLTNLHNDFIKRFSKLENPQDIHDVYDYDAIKKRLCGKVYSLVNSYKDCGLDVDAEDSKSPIDALFALQTFLDFYKAQLTAIKEGTKLAQSVIKQANTNYRIQKTVNELVERDLAKKPASRTSDFPKLPNRQLETIFELDETMTSQEIYSSPKNQNELGTLSRSSWHFFSQATNTSEDKSFDTAEFYNTPIEAIEQEYNVRTDRTESRYSFANSIK